MRRVGVDRVGRDLRPAVVIERLAGVGVYVETWKVAAGDIEPDAMAALKHESRGMHLDCEFVGFSRLDEFFYGAALA